MMCIISASRRRRRWHGGGVPGCSRSEVERWREGGGRVGRRKQWRRAAGAPPLSPVLRWQNEQRQRGEGGGRGCIPEEERKLVSTVIGSSRLIGLSGQRIFIGRFCLFVFPSEVHGSFTGCFIAFCFLHRERGAWELSFAALSSVVYTMPVHVIRV